MVETPYVSREREAVKPIPEQRAGLIEAAMRWMSRLDVAVFRCEPVQ